MFFGSINSSVKKNIAKIMAGVTAASAIMGFGMHQVYGGNETTLEDILGGLYQYGVVANELTISTDMESNFAVNVLYVSGHTTGNSVGRMTNVGGVMYAREIRSASEKWSDDEWAQYGDLKIRSGNYLITGKDFNRVNDGHSQIDNQYYWWKDQDGKITVNDEMSKQLEIVNDADYLNITEEKKRVLSILNSFEINAGKEEFTNGIIDVTKYRDGVVTINYDITDGVNNNLTIKKNADQLLIINAISEKNSANDTNTVAKYLLSVDGGEAKATLDNNEAKKVIWNFGIYKGKLIIGDNGGVFVAPNAKVTNSGTASGNLIAGAFDNSSGEWHHWNPELKEETTAETTAPDMPEKTTPQPTTPDVTTDKNEDNTTTENEVVTTDKETPPEVDTTVPPQPTTSDEIVTSTEQDSSEETTPQATTPDEVHTTEIVPDETTVPQNEEPSETTVPQNETPGETTVPQNETPGETTVPRNEEPDETTVPQNENPGENETTAPQNEDPEENGTTPDENVDINDRPPLGNETTPAGEKNPPKEDPTTEYDPDDELIQLDDLTPLGAPQTGDHSRIYVYVALAGLALGVSILSVVLGKKKEQR